MEILNAIVEVASNLQTVVPMGVREPECNPWLVEQILNNEIVQTVWGWSKAVPELFRYVVVPVMGVIVGLFIFGVLKVARRALKWILGAAGAVVLFIFLTGVSVGTDWFQVC